MNITITLFAQMFAFILLVWMVNKVMWTPMSALLEARQKRIADGLEAAEKGTHALALAEKRAVELIKEAKNQAAEVLAGAQKRAGEIVEEAKGTAQEEGGRIKAAANAEIEQELNRAKEQLRAQLASIAVAGAEKVLQREIDAKAHNKILADLANQI